LQRLDHSRTITRNSTVPLNLADSARKPTSDEEQQKGFAFDVGVNLSVD